MFYFSNSVPSHSSTTCTSSDVANSDEIENEEETCLSAADAQMHTSPWPSVNSCPSPQTIINQDQESLDSHGGDIGKIYHRVHSLDNKAKYSLLKTPFAPSIMITRMYKYTKFTKLLAIAI